ncbi:hypothetical protein BU23DRAFT_568653 [Bimuria novae-zelandiae CBS 107.79]|uniref:Uncharacterized protein n=1 Tax=Bimuria novae-zelandiae CBS 107.79 TaxID=1447943 RepID=A0A6A5V6R0_9PLEO|nr:hypothetical protein BU23DRAFT_568653 [Bimuria novae-zelandiae CBS 107.79]
MTRSKNSGHESTDTLLGAYATGIHAHLAQHAAGKPSILHPSIWLKPSPIIGGVTLNTAIAFAAALFRICLMVPVTDCICQLTWVSLERGFKPLQNIIKFDMASRGPIGSLQLLFEFTRYSPMVTITSLLKIVGIAIGSFYYQSVDFYSASVPSVAGGANPLTAFASAAFTYLGNVGNVGGSFANYGRDLLQHFFVVKTKEVTSIGREVLFNLGSAIYSGLHSSDMISLPYPPYSCPTGNCTWDLFLTLGVSVQCFDDATNYFLNCSQDSTTWPGHSLRSCNMVINLTTSNNYPPSNPLSYLMVYDSYAAFHPTSPTAVDPRYNSSLDYGFTGNTETTWTSINAGFASFDWHLTRNLLIFPAKYSRSSVVTSESITEAGYCLFYIDMQILSAQIQNGLYQE